MGLSPFHARIMLRHINKALVSARHNCALQGGRGWWGRTLSFLTLLSIPSVSAHLSPKPCLP